MPFPEGLPTKLVHLTVNNPAGGTAATGTVRLSPNVPAVVIDGTPTQWTGSGTYRLNSQGQLVDTDGTTVGVRLLDNTVAGSNPQGWLWHALVAIDGQPPHAFYFTLAGTPAEVDLAELMQVDPDVPRYVAVPGPEGPAGTPGPAGAAGADGQNGASAYQVWLAAGNTGSVSDFLASLTGPTGPQGPAGPQPPLGTAGAGDDVALRSTDPSTTNARTPTAHAASHASGGSDPVTPAAIGADPAGTATAAVTTHTTADDPHGYKTWADAKFATLSTVSALNTYVDDTVNRIAAVEDGTAWLSGLNIDGNAQIANGDLAVHDNVKGYRFRRGGSALDLEATGADLIVSNWSGTGFNGTQYAFDRYASNALAAQHAGLREFVSSLYGTVVHTIDPNGNRLGFHGKPPVTQQAVTGSRSDGTALANLLAALDTLGFIDDQSTA
ncbi:hypothetical protein [Streptomyces griseosporeus]